MCLTSVHTIRLPPSPPSFDWQASVCLPRRLKIWHLLPSSVDRRRRTAGHFEPRTTVRTMLSSRFRERGWRGLEGDQEREGCHFSRKAEGRGRQVVFKEANVSGLDNNSSLWVPLRPLYLYPTKEHILDDSQFVRLDDDGRRPGCAEMRNIRFRSIAAYVHPMPSSTFYYERMSPR